MMLIAALIYLAIGCGIFSAGVAAAFGRLPGFIMLEPEAGNLRETICETGPIVSVAVLIFVALLWPLIVLHAEATR